MALHKTVILNVVQYCMYWSLNEIFFLLIASPRYSLGGKKFAFPQVSSLAANTRSDAAENSFDFPAPVTLRHSSGNSSTRFEAEMLFGSLHPSSWPYAYT